MGAFLTSDADLDVVASGQTEAHFEAAMRDAVATGDPAKATNLLNAESGDDEMDFYVRNRTLITEWDALQTLAGQVLHTALIAAGEQAGFRPNEGKRGWTTVTAMSPGLERLMEERGVSVELAWMKPDLLSTRRGYPSPRLALTAPPTRWRGENRLALAREVSPTARALRLTKKGDAWWLFWRVLDQVAESESLQAYAASCIEELRTAAVRFSRVVQKSQLQPSEAAPSA